MALRPENGPLLIAVGAIVIWWGRIEGLLFQQTMSLAHHPEVAKTGICEPLQIATVKLIRQWAKASRLVMSDVPSWQDEISEIKAELTDCAETRHVLVHGFWHYPMPDDDILKHNVTVIKPDKAGNVKLNRYEIDYQTLNEFHNRLARLYHGVLNATINVGTRLPKGERPTVELSETAATVAFDPPLPLAPSQTPN